MSFSVQPHFFSSFTNYKNVLYNLRILNKLYEVNSPSGKLLIKPIIIIEVSLIEVFIYEFLYRIKYHRIEGVEGLDEAIIDEIQSGDDRIDQYGALVKIAEEKDLFNEKDSNFYQRLKELGYIRNRIHIQNIHNNRPKSESALYYNPKVLRSTEKCLEKVVKTLANHPRPKSIQQYLSVPLKFPWEEHFNN